MNKEYSKTRQAAETVAARVGFFVHAGVFAAVVLLLALVNLYTAPNELWVQWVFLGWGLGVALHGMLLFGRWPSAVRAWQLRKIRSAREQM